MRWPLPRGCRATCNVEIEEKGEGKEGEEKMEYQVDDMVITSFDDEIDEGMLAKSQFSITKKREERRKRRGDGASDR
jgi:hypothetical protein